MEFCWMDWVSIPGSHFTQWWCEHFRLNGRFHEEKGCGTNCLHRNYKFGLFEGFCIELAFKSVQVHSRQFIPRICFRWILFIPKCMCSVFSHFFPFSFSFLLIFSLIFWHPFCNKKWRNFSGVWNRILNGWYFNKIIAWKCWH